MIRKILTNEYLKPVGAMSAQDREAWRRRVGEWLARDGERLLTMTDRPMARGLNSCLGREIPRSDSSTRYAVSLNTR